MNPIKVNFNRRDFLKGAVGCAVKVGGVFNFVARDKFGAFKWEADAKNLVTTEGCNHITDLIFGNDTIEAGFYVGLKNAGTPAAGDTLATHATWTENTNYSGNRPSFVAPAASGGSTSNTASKASFSIDTNGQTIAGGFLCSAATGTTGILLCAADFTGGNKSLDSGDTLEVTYTFASADDAS